MKSLLITGGAGYIGSHTVLDLLDNNYEVTIIDDLSNSKKKVIESIKQISKKRKSSFYKIDLKNEEKLENVLRDIILMSNSFWGYKAAENPWLNHWSIMKIIYLSTINILKLMKNIR